MIEFRLILFGVSFLTVELGSSSVIFVSNCIVNCCRQTDDVYVFSCTRRLGAILWRTTPWKCNQSLLTFLYGITFHLFGDPVEPLRN